MSDLHLEIATTQHSQKLRVNPKTVPGGAMIPICRHIKTSGERCKSPAMRDHSFCYFHARVHSRTRSADRVEISFSVPEDFAAIQESIAKVFDGIVSGRISPQQSSQILRGLHLAMQTIPRKPAPPADSVQELTLSKKGDELAPPLELPALELESGSSQKALPACTCTDPACASGNFVRVKSVRAEILGSIQQGQLLIGEEKVLRCLDKPHEPGQPANLLTEKAP
jgi:hypothetical protein